MLEDVQSHSASVALPIDNVGVKGLQVPLCVRDKEHGQQHTVALIDLSVSLPAAFKGTHMSRFVEALENWSETLDYHSMLALLETVKKNLQAKKARVVFRFPYFIRKEAPASKRRGIVPYNCEVIGELELGAKPLLWLYLEVPVMTVCPCSKAISDEGAHSQRAYVRMKIRHGGFAWIEDFVQIAEAAASSPVYALLKREDEKWVTEKAFENPTFVEDVVRNVAKALQSHEQVDAFCVEVESMESIHAHNAFASIESDKKITA